MWVVPAGAAGIHPVGDGQRLFALFVEDGAIMPRGWVGIGLAYADGPQEGRDRAAGTVLAWRLGRDVEAGLEGGFLDRRRDAGTPLYGAPPPEAIDDAGLADLSLYGKYRVVRSPFDLAVGGRAILPLADESAGLGPGVVQYEVFTGLRGSLARLALVGSIGASARGDSQAPGSAEGRTALKAGCGALIPLSLLWTISAELTYEGARFEGEDPDARAIIGIDWRPTKFLAARVAAGAGLTDGAPDFTAVVAGALLF
jgi:hypothetical protein